MKIIQWNMNGYINYYCELPTIIKKHTPLISLQETHIQISIYLFQETPHPPTVAWVS